jgi:hypothetical protein
MDPTQKRSSTRWSPVTIPLYPCDRYIAAHLSEGNRGGTGTARLRLSLYADGAVVFINPIKSKVDLIMDIM